MDAMGGDQAPQVVVQGAVKAASELGIGIILVGNEKKITGKLPLYASGEDVSVYNCEEAVHMHEHPLKAVRQKKDASIRVAFDLVKRGNADAVVSAGNSGATLAAAVLALGRMEEVERPAIANIFPGEMGPVVLLDVGANVDCRPAHLFQFGVMGQAFASACLGIKNPKIGILSIGEESGKGNEQVRLTQELFEQSQLNFVGNVEGHNLFWGDVGVIVCDGFVGNIALKLAEGMALTMTKSLKMELTRSCFGRVASLFGRRALNNFEKKLNYEEYGGAPLLGINGVGIVCHGASSARAITNAVKLAALYVNNKGLQKMVLQLKALSPQKKI